jgi:hypothetical protein
MGHFANVNENSIVINVVVMNDENPQESASFLETRLGGTWIQTSYNTQAGQHLQGGTPLRKNFAGIGSLYSLELDAFFSPSPYESWVLNEESCTWEAPIPYPKDDKDYRWNEPTTSWVER